MNYNITDLPGELQVLIKKQLDNKSLLEYNLTCKSIFEYNQTKCEIQARKCGLYNPSSYDYFYIYSWKCGHKECILYLRDLGYDRNDFSSGYYRRCTELLNKACLKRNFEFIDFLIDEAGVFYDKETIYKCCAYDDISVLKHLIGKADYSVYLKDLLREHDDCDYGYGTTIVHYICMSNKMNILKFLIEEKKIDIEDIRFESDTDSCKYNAFHYACLCGNLEMIKYLVDNFNLTSTELIVDDHIVIENLFDNEFGGKYCYCNCGNEYVCEMPEMVFDVIKYLVERFNLTIENFMEDTSIIYRVCKGGYLDILKYLVKDLGFIRGRFDEEPIFDAAVKSKNLDIMNYLIENMNFTFEDIREYDDYAYKTAKKNRDSCPEMVEYLEKIYLENGIDVNEIGEYEGSYF